MAAMMEMEEIVMMEEMAAGSSWSRFSLIHSLLAIMWLLIIYSSNSSRKNLKT
jgi:hypothetical protein